MIYPSPSVFLAAAGLDLVLGDPHWLPHPVRWIGRLVKTTEDFTRRWLPRRLVLAGFFTLAICLVGSVFLSVVVLAWIPGPWVAIYVVTSLLALRSLDQAAMGVTAKLRAGQIELARSCLAGIVGRDTSQLDSDGIIRAVVETVTENLSDGIVAPTLFLAVAGLPGMVAYKCINTLDSMVGYRNERYREFGYCAARLDDWANWIPARLSAVLLLCSGCMLGLPFRRGWLTVRRDGRKHSSPNAGYPEAAAAGLLDIRLGGPNTYFGVLVQKPWIGSTRDAPALQILGALRGLLYVSSLLAYILALITIAGVNSYA